MSPEQQRRFAADLQAGPHALDSSNAGEGLACDLELRCQWCAVPLQPGVTLCPTCGSPGVPDPRFTKPDPARERSDELEPEFGVLGLGEQAAWGDEVLTAAVAPVKAPRTKMTAREAESRQKRTLLFAGAAVLVCALLGWLAGPLLAGFIESFTGTPVEDTGDLRPMGAFIGMLAGFFAGGLGGIVIWMDR